jgi:hypothetical protein
LKPTRRIIAVLAFAMPLAIAACITDADLAPTKSSCPAPDDFRIVSQVLERRCGTLDCHGQEGRPFRVYGRDGLRKPDSGQGGEYVSGGMVETTDSEVDSNYHSACGLEAERMANVVAKKEPLATLTVVRKPRLEEAHKGGMVLPRASSGDKCFTSWIAGAVDHQACVTELMMP